MREYYYNYDLIGEFWSVGRLVDSLCVCGKTEEVRNVVYWFMGWFGWESWREPFWVTTVVGVGLW